MAVQQFFSTKWVYPILILTVVLNIVWFGRRGCSQGGIGPGTRAPDFSLPLADGSDHRQRLTDLRGKVVLLEFWATWCEPCKGDVATLNRIHDTLGADVVVLAVATPDSGGPDAIARFVRDTGARYLVVEDDGRAVGPYGVESLPTRFLIDRGGTIRHVMEGVSDDHAVIEALRGLTRASGS